MKLKNIAELNQMYLEAESEDKDVFSEMRSNVLLVAGNHYAKKQGDKHFNRLRDTKVVSETQRLRLTKNHIAKISNHYEEAIMSQSPGVRIVPQVDSELQDQKDAELNQAVWTFVKYKQKMREKIRAFARDFVQLGEVAAKIFWDPSKGEIIGYAQKVDEAGLPVVDAMGQPVADDNEPVYSGDIVYERIFGFNLLRAPGSKSMEESPVLIYRKMSDISDLKMLYRDEEDKLKFIQESGQSDFVVFDQNKAQFNRTKDQILIKEYYFKPCMEYPEGYFYITTDLGVLEEGPLPFGIYPIIWRGFDLHATLPRGFSVIKRARPYQAEINRAASQQATHQVTLADDKILYSAGSKLAPGALLPGVRGITFQGQPPTILAGRTGEQFTQYIMNTIDEMYQVVELEELTEDNPAQSQVDPWANLFKQIRQKKKFSKYGETFEGFLQDLCTVSLEILKQYLPDDTLIQMVGRKEIVNIPEFKKTTPLGYQIKVEAMDDTIETQMGKQLTINQIMQYVGKQLDPESIGKLIRSMPFGNIEESFDDMTLDYDNCKNDMLALERGDAIQANQSDDPDYYIKRLSSRMKKADFRYLSPEIQENYRILYTQYVEFSAQKAEKIQAAQNEFIPTNGPMVGVDMYVEDKEDPSKAPKRARLPTSAVEWLVKQMEMQGSTLNKLEQHSQTNLANISEMLLSSKGGNEMPQGGMNGQPSNINPGIPGNGTGQY